MMRPSYTPSGQSSAFDPNSNMFNLIDPRLTTMREMVDTPAPGNLAIRHQAAEAVIKPAPKVVYRQSMRTLPYFGHQQLDLDYFPEFVGAPVCDCPAGSTGEGWDVDADVDADEDGDHVTDLDSEAENDLDLEGARATTKARRKSKGKATSQSVDGHVTKRIKVAGGRPAVAKKVTADLDSDDELIVRMKEARYLEKDIAQALIDQGRTAYNPKTIGTRWRRLKAALAKRNDALLDADLTDWHEGDDDVLVRAIQKADKEVRRLTADIDSKRWRMVADAMKNEKPVLNFSQHACRKRFEELRDGTAKPTPESIENPTPEVLERIRSRQMRQRNLDEQNPQETLEMQNVEGNGWTSRMRTYF